MLYTPPWAVKVYCVPEDDFDNAAYAPIIE